MPMPMQEIMEIDIEQMRQGNQMLFRCEVPKRYNRSHRRECENTTLDKVLDLEEVQGNVVCVDIKRMMVPEKAESKKGHPGFVITDFIITLKE